MNHDKITVVARRTHFEPTTTTALVANPVSAVAVQGFMQMLASQGQKVDALARRVEALATRPRQEVTVSSALPAPKAAAETASPGNKTAPTKTRVPRINRRRLRDIFD
jgi:hypothetical protein